MRVRTLTSMRTQPFATCSGSRGLLLVLVQGVEKVLEEGMKWESFGMVVRSVRISEDNLRDDTDRRKK